MCNVFQCIQNYVTPGENQNHHMITQIMGVYAPTVHKILQFNTLPYQYREKYATFMDIFPQ